MGLPSDIIYLILTFVTEPLYTPPKWIPVEKRKIIYSNSYNNPKAFRWIKKNWASLTNKTNFLKNPNPSMDKLIKELTFNKSGISQLCTGTRHNIRFDYTTFIPEQFIDCLEYVFKFCPSYEFIMRCINRYEILSMSEPMYVFANTNNEVISKCLSSELFRNMLIDKKSGWEYLASNTNPIALDFINNFLENNHEHKLTNIHMNELSSNPNNKALGILEKYPELINLDKLITNPNPRAYELFIRYLSGDPINILRTTNECEWALPLIKQKINECNLSNSDKLGDYLEKLILNTNPEVVELLDGYLDLIKSTGKIKKISCNKTHEIIKWIGLHLEYVRYSGNNTGWTWVDNSQYVDIYELAVNNNHLLQDNYLGRFPKKLAGYLGLQ